MTIRKLKRMQVGETVLYPNPPMSSSLLVAGLSVDGRSYCVEVLSGMLSRSFRVTRTK